MHSELGLRAASAHPYAVADGPPHRTATRSPSMRHVLPRRHRIAAQARRRCPRGAGEYERAATKRAVAEQVTAIMRRAPRWALTALLLTGRGASAQPATPYTLINKDVECLSGDAFLGQFGSALACAGACAATAGCDFFIFGRPPRAAGTRARRGRTAARRAGRCSWRRARRAAARVAGECVPGRTGIAEGCFAWFREKTAAAQDLRRCDVAPRWRR